MEFWSFLFKVENTGNLGILVLTCKSIFLQKWSKTAEDVYRFKQKNYNKLSSDVYTLNWTILKWIYW